MLGHRLVHVAELVVAAEEVDPLRVHRLQREEQRDHLELVRAAVDPVSVEDVPGRYGCQREVALARLSVVS